jgi:hypothetical protein
MLKSLLAAAAVAAVVGFTGGQAWAQTQAQSACATAAAQASDNILLRLQQPALAAETRESAKAHLAMAGNAAALGNEAECWKQLKVSAMFVPLPSTAAQTAVAAGH